MTVEYTLLALAVPALLAAAGFAVWTRLRTRRMLDTLGKMLDDAIRGEFRESLYDESRLSALEPIDFGAVLCPVGIRVQRLVSVPVRSVADYT